MQTLLILLIPFLLWAQPVKVASYNVQNLFDDKVQGTEYDEYVPGKHNWSTRMMQIKIDHTAEVLCELNADIVGLQEVENDYVFDLLIKRLKRVGCTYGYWAISHKKGSSIQVALLSRFPIRYSKDIQVSYAPRVRNILEAEVDIKGKALILFVNHWKSKGRKGYESKRLAYAKALEKRIHSLPSHKEYIILGDLNTNYNAHLTLKKRLNDTNGVTGLNHVLKTVSSNRLIDKVEIAKGKKGEHFNLWQELPYRERWSHKFYGNKSTLDHILLPPSLFDGRNIDYVNHSFSVFKSTTLLSKKGYVKSWQINGSRHTGKGYSDHLPVYAYVDLKPFAASKNSVEKKAVVTKTIDDLYGIERLDTVVVLKDAVVVLKRGKYAVIKQKPRGRGIFLYGTVNDLEEGRKYDFRVQEISTYKGLKEITALVKLKEKGSVDLSPYYQRLEIGRQNEVLRDFTALYKNRHLYVNGQKIPVYFRNKKLRPKNAAKLKIHYAHLGYYKKLQLVIYSKKDFEILEN